jgi:hypothetical protein
LASREHIRQASALRETQLTSELVFGERGLKTYFAQIRQLRLECGQQNDLTTDPQYFILANRLNRRSTVAVLIRRGAELEGCVLVQQYRRFGLRLGLARVGDSLGESQVVGPSSLRLQFVQVAANALLYSARFHAIFVTIRAPLEACVAALGPESKHRRYSRRELRYKLPLAATYADMLAAFGPRTRRSLAGKRRQLEQSLNVAFQPEISVKKAFEAMLFLRERSLPKRNQAFLQARREFQEQTPDAFCMGMHTPAGDWLSILSGWRRGGVTYIDLQMNDHNYRQQSLSAVMRAFMLEHEIALGQKTVSFVNGCSALLARYCSQGESCTDIYLSRPGLRSRLFTALVSPEKLDSVVGWAGPTLTESQAEKQQRRFPSTSLIESLPRKSR